MTATRDERLVIGYLNRPTRDGRTITHLTFREGRLPIIGSSGGPIGWFTPSLDGDVVWAEVHTDVFVDWSLWHPVMALDNTDIHTIVGSNMKMTGQLVGASLGPRQGWPWDEQPTVPSCGYMQCRNRAEFYGPSWSTLDADETYPSFCCPDHIGHLAIIRRVGHGVTDQPDGFPIHTTREFP